MLDLRNIFLPEHVSKPDLLKVHNPTNYWELVERYYDPLITLLPTSQVTARRYSPKALSEVARSPH